MLSFPPFLGYKVALFVFSSKSHKKERSWSLPGQNIILCLQNFYHHGKIRKVWEEEESTAAAKEKCPIIFQFLWDFFSYLGRPLKSGKSIKARRQQESYCQITKWWQKAWRWLERSEVVLLLKCLARGANSITMLLLLYCHPSEHNNNTWSHTPRRRPFSDVPAKNTRVPPGMMPKRGSSF